MIKANDNSIIIQFRRMLNKELSQFAESKSANQISEFILSTYMGKHNRIIKGAHRAHNYLLVNSVVHSPA